MKLRPSEEHIRSLFKNHEQPVDTDELWEKMQKKKKPKRRLIWLRFLGLILPLVLIGGYLLLNTFGNKIDHSISAVEENISSEVDGSKISDNSKLNKNINNRALDLAVANDKQVLKNNDNLQLTDRNTPSKNTTTDQIEYNQSNDDISFLDNNKNVKSNATKNSENYYNSPDKRKKNTESIDDMQSPVTSVSSRQDLSNKAVAGRVSDELKKRNNNLNSNLENTNNKNKANTVNSFNKTSIMDAKSSKDKYTRVSQLPILRNILFYDRPLILEMDDVKAIPVLEEDEPSRYTTLSIIAGIGLGNKNLNARDFRDTLYIKARKEAEKIHSIWNGALKLGFHKNNFVFNTGISYRQHIESLRYSSRNVSISEEEGPISIIVDGQGSIISTENGIITTTTTTSYDFLKRNRYHYIGIPLELGGDFPIGKFRLGLLASTEISMAIKRSGAYLDTADSFLDFSATESIIDYDKKILLQLGLRSTLSYAIRENVNFTIQPYAMRYINSMTTAVNSLEEKPFHFGLDFGFVYRWSR